MMSKPKGKEGPWKADKVREASNGRFVRMQTGVGVSKNPKSWRTSFMEATCLGSVKSGERIAD